MLASLFFLNINCHLLATDTCSEISTIFGSVKYIDTTPTRYSARNSKNEVYALSGDCANDCLETAGCFSFSDNGGNCVKIIGASRDEGEDQSVVDSGKLSSACDNSAVLSQGFSMVNEKFPNEIII